jgi:hypothetical protein
VGVFDVLGEVPAEDLHQFHNQSTVPIVRFQGNSSDDSSSGEEELYMQFDSDEDGLPVNAKKAVVIEEIDSTEFSNQD